MRSKIKKIIILVPLFLGLIIFSGCAIKFDASKGTQEKMEKAQKESEDFWENEGIEQQKEQAEDFIQKGISQEAKDKIDKWIEENDLNKYGDSKNIMYAGGTPLFDEFTGETIDRYDYILINHPELIEELELE